MIYSMTALAEIRVIWRQPDTMALWGIPYEMRPGQAPRDLYNGRRVNTSIPSCGIYRSESSPGVREDWIYLGSPGWWGSMTKEDQAAVTSWLDLVTGGRPRQLPQEPSEWIRVAEIGRVADWTGPTGAEEPDE